jgi:putative YhbY family RNA-binding protein
MPAIELTPAERKSLKAAAHSLSPVAAIGKAGITPAVLKEIDVCLRSHGLIKVRAGSDERGEREAWLADLAGQLDCAPVQSIGRILVLWRPLREADDQSAEAVAGRTGVRPPATKPGHGAARRKTKRSYQSG